MEFIRSSSERNCLVLLYYKYVMLHIKLQRPSVLLLRAACCIQNFEDAAIFQNVSGQVRRMSTSSSISCLFQIIETLTRSRSDWFRMSHKGYCNFTKTSTKRQQNSQSHEYRLPLAAITKVLQTKVSEYILLIKSFCGLSVCHVIDLGLDQSLIDQSIIKSTKYYKYQKSVLYMKRGPYVLRKICLMIETIINITNNYQLLHQCHKILAACNIQRERACEFSFNIAQSQYFVVMMK